MKDLKFKIYKLGKKSVMFTNLKVIVSYIQNLQLLIKIFTMIIINKKAKVVNHVIKFN